MAESFSHNKKILGKYFGLIKELEKEVIGKMEDLADYTWPSEKKVRVDVVTYANWAGAYTVTRPEMNIVISTIDEKNTTTSFIETIFHEGTHLLFPIDGSPFRAEIYYKSKEMKLRFQRHLWHASQFFLCGRITQDKLKAKGISHKLLMEELKIFTAYNTTHFRQTLEKYYKGEYDLKTTVKYLLEVNIHSEK
ncbi:MAG: hypothetical protein AAGC43_00060 [Bacteroidota bacterium]